VIQVYEWNPNKTKQRKNIPIVTHCFRKNKHNMDSIITSVILQSNLGRFEGLYKRCSSVLIL
jgi:hypothetical protein